MKVHLPWFSENIFIDFFGGAFEMKFWCPGDSFLKEELIINEWLLFRWTIPTSYPLRVYEWRDESVSTRIVCAV